MKLLLQAIKSLIRKVEKTAEERIRSFFGKDDVIKHECLPAGYPYRTVEQTLSTTHYKIDSNEGSYFFRTPLTLEEGQEYIVDWNGTEYSCIAECDSNYQPSLGRFMRAEEPSVSGDEPFGITPKAFYGYNAITPYDGSTEGTVSITGIIRTKIDPLYLPDPILSSPNGTRFKITVDDDGTLSATAITG